MKWSKYQKAIFKNVAEGEGNLVVNARAGSGKTSSLIEALNYIPPFDDWLLCAFNKRIANELKRRAPENSNGQCKTLHSLGLRAVKERWPFIDIEVKKVWDILDDLVGKDKKFNDIKFQIKKAITLCKGRLVNDYDDIDLLLDDYNIDIIDYDRDEFIKLISKTLLACYEDTDTVDFDDMIWFPNMYDLNAGSYQRIFIDECVHKDTLVLTDAGQKNVSQLNVGDKILSYENGSAVFKKVTGKKKSKKTTGIKVHTKSGESLSMTNNHRLYATKADNSFIAEGKLALYLMYRSDLGFRIGVTKALKTRGRGEGADKIWILGIFDEDEALYLEQYYSLEYRIPTYLFRGTVRGLNQERINKIFNHFGKNGLDLLDKFNLDFKYPHWTSTTNSTNNLTRKVLYLRAHQHKDHKTYGSNYKTAPRSSFRFECFSEDFIDIKSLPKEVQVYKSKGRTLIMGSSKNYSEIKKLAQKTADIIGAFLVETLSSNDELFVLINAGALLPGMKLFKYKSGNKNNVKLYSLKELSKKYDLYSPKQNNLNFGLYMKIRNKQIELGEEDILPHPDNSSFEVDEITAITPIENEEFWDISVEETENFFANNILTHNCQDLNKGQIELALSCCNDDGRITLLGDDKQAIYQFTGVNINSFDDLTKRLDAETLPLPITYRCPVKITKHAQQYAPDIQHAPGAPEGVLEYITSKEMRERAKPGCFILSRVNAPLIGLALGFIRQGTPCNIQGRDIGANLINLIKKSRRKTTKSFIKWLDAWEEKEIKRLRMKGRSTVTVVDKAECLRALADDCTKVSEMKEKIKNLFEDEDDTSRIMLSTVHRAKGLERNIVFVLSGTFFGSGQEERNIKYVAATRSAGSLYLVTGGNYSKFKHNL